MVIALAVLLAIMAGSASEPGPRSARCSPTKNDGTQVEFVNWASGYPWGCTNEATGEWQYYSPQGPAGPRRPADDRGRPPLGAVPLPQARSRR